MKHRLGQHSLWFLRALGRSARFPLAISPAFASVVVVLSTCLSWWVLTVPAQAAGPAAFVAVQLSSPSIVANGTTTTTATATVTDASSNPVAGDTVTFTSDSGNGIAPVIGTDNGNGTYTSTITSTTHAGTATITATDSTGPSGQASLTQTPGPAALVTVQLSPSAILANGISASTATATVTDANGNPVAGDTVTFASDSGNPIAPVIGTDDGNGTYTTTVTSTAAPGNPTITATDVSVRPNVSGQATLTQGGPIPSNTTLSAAPTSAVTNQVVTLSAATSSGVAPSGSITFENSGVPILGCSNVPEQANGQIVDCQTSFFASPSPELLTAIFTPSPGTIVSGSTSPTVALTVGKDSTATALQTSATSVNVGASVTYSASVTPSQPGTFPPTGTVQFLNGSTAIQGCSTQPVVIAPGSATASCTLRYSTPATHHITAVYSGNAKFNSSTSSQVRVAANALPLLGAITSTMQWSFFFSPTYTKVLQLLVQNAPVGSTVLVQCHGHGCPFTQRSTVVAKAKPCKKKAGHKCPARHVGLIDLVSRFRNRHLQIGARIIVEIIRPRFIGKYYTFVVQARHAPRIQIKCVVPGSKRPGVGCG